MRRLKDGYLEAIESVVPLAGKKVLEIGCGSGSRSVQIAARCASLAAIDPDAVRLAEARRLNPAANIDYREGSATDLSLRNESFDLVIFTLSLHHIPVSLMVHAITEAVRVVKKEGHVVFFEPSFEGTFFDAEIMFEAGDGDERKEKACAYYSILDNPSLQEIAEIYDETVMQFDNMADFVATMHPHKNLDQLDGFLASLGYALNAQRRINIFMRR